jgi:hypothetical protein
MKAISAMIVVLFVTGCSGMGMSGRSGMGNMHQSGASQYPNSINSGFDPNNPYHGG